MPRFQDCFYILGFNTFLCCYRFTFCAQDPEKTEISPGESITFIKCRDGWEVKPRKRYENDKMLSE